MRTSEATGTSEATSTSEATGITEWVPLSSHTFFTPALALGASAAFGLVFLIQLFFQVGRFAVDSAVPHAPLGEIIGLDVAATVVLLALAIVVFVIAQRLRFPAPSADFGSGRLRVGRSVVPFERITWARLDVQGTTKHRQLTLRFGATGGPQALFDLTAGKRGRITEQQRQNIAEVLRRSAVTLPVTSYDPTSRFARYNFPAHIDKEAAIAVTLRTPTSGEPLPVVDPTR